jgi:hypothetical protein
MKQALRILLEGLIDYAGLFPPAQLGMVEAIKNYAAYRRSPHSWMLGRFILPVGRLNEFAQAAAEHWPRGNEAEIWPLSVLGTAQLEADIAAINSFNQRRTMGDLAVNAVVDTIEIKATHIEEIETALRVIPSTLTCYVEIPIANAPAKLIQAIAESGALAKVRTGGVTADGFPSAHDLAHFIALCAKEDVGFKATAGLHHPLRAINRLTYQADSETALMHGFLNVFLAAAFAQNGMDVTQLTALLEETSPAAFRFTEDSVFWHEQMLVKAHLRNTRRLFATAFGSCSFTEPFEDLQKIGLL